MGKYQNHYGNTKARIWTGEVATSFSIDRSEAKALRKSLNAYLRDEESTNRLYFNMYPGRASKKTGMSSISIMSMKKASARNS